MELSLPVIRARRNRSSAAIRSLIEETHLPISKLVVPLFVMEGNSIKSEICGMPGVYRYSLDLLDKYINHLASLGIVSLNLFCAIESSLKNSSASEAIKENNLLVRAIKKIKSIAPQICLMVDIALDPFTDHGHDGILNEKNEVDNDSTLNILGKMALLAARAGADIVSPSDMMDGRVAFIRHYLDSQNFFHVGILSYAAKYASAFYGPFREALGSTLSFGDKKSYQLNPSNSTEAIRECLLDVKEGADMLLIKPALSYLDIIHQVKTMTTLPVGAYQVSGEYAMIMAASEKGWVDRDKAFVESLISIRRAGADFIITYAAEIYINAMRF